MASEGKMRVIERYRALKRSRKKVQGLPIEIETAKDVNGTCVAFGKFEQTVDFDSHGRNIFVNLMLVD